MSNSLSKCSFALMIVALTAFSTTESASAAEDDPTWRIGLEFALVDPTGDFTTTTGGGVNYDTGFGAGVRVEYQFSRRYGVELSVLSVSSVDLSSGTFGSSVNVSEFTPVMVGLNVHLTPGRPVDVYAGPLLAMVRYSNVEFSTSFLTANTSVSVDNDLGWGAIVGIDVPLGGRGWLVQANLRYIDTDLKGSSGAFSIDSDFDPLIFSLGFGYRF